MLNEYRKNCFGCIIFNGSSEADMSNKTNELWVFS